jgi:hypothetical protein
LRQCFDWLVHQQLNIELVHEVRDIKLMAEKVNGRQIKYEQQDMSDIELPGAL